jgi:hypothetical protein
MTNTNRLVGLTTEMNHMTINEKLASLTTEQRDGLNRIIVSSPTIRDMVVFYPEVNLRVLEDLELIQKRSPNVVYTGGLISDFFAFQEMNNYA